MASISAIQTTPDTMETQPNISSTAVVLYKPLQFQNRTLLPLPIGWTTASRTPESLTRFSNLPSELRLQIYNIELFQPRILKLTTGNDPDIELERCRGIPVRQEIVRSSIPNSALLFVNHETRTEALKRLRVLDFRSEVYVSKFSFGLYAFDTSIYFNMACDAFAFNDPKLLQEMALEKFAGTRALGLWFIQEIFFRPHFMVNYRVVMKIKSLLTYLPIKLGPGFVEWDRIPSIL